MEVARLALLLSSSLALACASGDPGESGLEVDQGFGSGGQSPTMEGSGGQYTGSGAGGGNESIVEGTGSGGNEAGSGGFVSSSGGAGSGGDIPGSGGMTDSGAGGFIDGGSGGSDADTCPYQGNVSYELNNPQSWPSDARELIVNAMDEAISYYNCYADLSKSITVNYDPGVPTAQANVDGWLSFGENKSYMQVATAMHEVGHTLGVGYFPWTELMDEGQWVGPNVDALMNSIPASERDDDEYAMRTYIRGDSQHFWPYGLNQASEYVSEWSLINHVRIVAAMQLDKQAYLNGEL